MGLWSFVTQLGLVSVFILGSNVLRRKIPFVRNTLLPTAVLAGFLLLAAKLLGIVHINLELMESVTYHCIAIGFIAMSLRIPEQNRSEEERLVGLKSGAVIASSYIIQGITGLAISIILGYTVMPGLFKACGILLPMGYGQGPGQANNTGLTYEALGFAGGRSFGLAIAAMGYVVACVVGVIYINYLVKKGVLRKGSNEDVHGSVSIDDFQQNNEVPIAESIDRFSIQATLVITVYLVTFLLTKGLTWFLSAYVPGLAKLLNSLLWGFNFMIGSGMAILTRVLMGKLKDKGIITRQYQNNYLMSRISGFAFDLMIVTGIASIEPEDISGLWLPFVLMAVIGGIITFIHLKYVCRKVYPGYENEGFISMFGMMTGTISSGVLLLREIDPKLETPAANNLVIGSSFAILLAAPLLLMVSIAPTSDMMTIIVVGICIVYYLFLLGIINIKGNHRAKKAKKKKAA